MLVMQAVKLSRGYGYSPNQGTLTPNYISYKGKQYRIVKFTSVINTVVTFENNSMPMNKITIEIEGNKYILNADKNYGSYVATDTRPFKAAGTYTIKILSIE